MKNPKIKPDPRERKVLADPPQDCDGYGRPFESDTTAAAITQALRTDILSTHAITESEGTPRR